MGHDNTRNFNQVIASNALRLFLRTVNLKPIVGTGNSGLFNIVDNFEPTP